MPTEVSAGLPESVTTLQVVEQRDIEDKLSNTYPEGPVPVLCQVYI